MVVSSFVGLLCGVVFCSWSPVLVLSVIHKSRSIGFPWSSFPIYFYLPSPNYFIEKTFFTELKKDFAKVTIPSSGTVK